MMRNIIQNIFFDSLNILIFAAVLKNHLSWQKKNRDIASQ